MDILIATTNQNKVNRIKKLIKNSIINFISLKDLDYEIKEPEENGKDGVENAIIKAKYYFNKLKVKIPVLTQDDTLFLFGVSKKDNPQKDIKLPVIKKYGKLTDEFAYQYYSDLVKKYGKEFLELEFRYGHAICAENLLISSSSTLPGRLYSQVNLTKSPGYFFSDMTKINFNGIWKYYSDLNKKELIATDQDFKKSIISLLEKLNLSI
jgi:hypothetical protein